MMKKFLALLLAAMMTLSTASASLLFGEPDDKQLPPETPAAAVAPVSLAALDAAFERGKVSLVPVEQPEGERLYSLSPAGNSALILTDDGLVAEYGGVRNPVHMAEERGVPDTYGNLATFCRMQPVQLLGEESVVYSPDGRYAAINNSYYVLMSMRAFFDPILIDLSTGEVFLAATYPNKMRDENMGMVTTGSFSADGKYYYYMVYGSIVMQGSRMKLFRYDMATGEVTECFNAYDNTYYPVLAELTDGGLMIIRDEMRKDEYQGLVIMRSTGRSWYSDEEDFALPMGQWYVRRMDYSAASGWAVTAGRLSGASEHYGLMRFRPTEDMAHLNEFIVIDNDGRLKVLTADEVAADLDAVKKDAESNMISTMPYQQITGWELSPDGRYVLLSTMDYNLKSRLAERKHVFILRLDDLALLEIDAELPDYTPANRRVFEWHTNTILVAEDSTFIAYTLE